MTTAENTTTYAIHWRQNQHTVHVQHALKYLFILFELYINKR